MKTCNKCNIQKDLNDFHKKPNTRDGRDSRCKSCVSKYKKHQNAKLKSKNSKQIHVLVEVRGTGKVSTDFYALIQTIISKEKSNETF